MKIASFHIYASTQMNSGQELPRIPHRERITVKTPATKQMKQIITLLKVLQCTSNLESFPISLIASKQVLQHSLPVERDVKYVPRYQ